MQFHVPEVAAANRHLVGPLIAELKSFAWSDVPCCVCGALRGRPAWEKEGITVCSCESCGHLWVSPCMPEEAAAILYSSRYWEELQPGVGSPSLEQRVEFDYGNGDYKLKRDVLPYRQAGRLLDVGASNGGLVRRAQELGFQAAGLEPSADVCALARRAHGVVMFAGTLAEQRFPDASWDVITLHDVLEHVLDPVDELREIRRVLAPGGLFACETPTSSSLDFADLGVEWPTLSPVEHLNYFDERNAARVLRACGFRILDLYSPHENNWIAIAEVPA